MKNQWKKHRFKFRVKKRQRTNRVKVGSGTFQGSIFGELRGALGRRWGAFLAFIGRSGALLGRFSGLMGASHFILDGFGKALGRVL